MRTKIKKMLQLFPLFIFLVLMSVGPAFSNAPGTIPDFSGNWDFTFYDAAGTLQGTKTLEVAEDGSISGKVILSLDNVIYNTEVSAVVAKNGKVNDGSLTDTDKLEMHGTLTGSFTDSEGSGKWQNYYGKSGTWQAKRSTKKIK